MMRLFNFTRVSNNISLYHRVVLPLQASNATGNMASADFEQCEMRYLGSYPSKASNLDDTNDPQAVLLAYAALI